MKSFVKLAAGMVLGAALSVSAAAQTTFTFGDFAGTAENADGSFDFTVGTLTVNARAFTFANGDTGLPFGTATPNDGLFIDGGGFFQGLGIDNDLFDAGDPDVIGDGSDSSTQIDGENFNEIVIFTFNQSIELVNIGFSLVGVNDDFDFIADATFGAGGITGSSIDNNDIPGTFFGGNIFDDDPLPFGPATSVGVAAIGGNDDFLVSSLSVNIVPEPATWLMMIVGFAFVGLASQRRRRIVTA